MTEPTLIGLHNRVSNLEDNVKTLQVALGKMEGDIQYLRERAVYSEAARDRQTDVLLDAINDRLSRAQSQVPTWASTLITVLAMACAALITAHYG